MLANYYLYNNIKEKIILIDLILILLNYIIIKYISIEKKKEKIYSSLPIHRGYILKSSVDARNHRKYQTPVYTMFLPTHTYLFTKGNTSWFLFGISELPASVFLHFGTIVK